MSWFFEPTRSLWLALDENVFWALNNSLAWGRGWQVFWAIANNRAVDIVAALCIIGLFAHFVLRKARDRMDFFVAVGLMLTGLIYVGSQLTGAIFVERPSPTLVHPNAMRLSELVFWIPTERRLQRRFPRRSRDGAPHLRGSHHVLPPSLLRRHRLGDRNRVHGSAADERRPLGNRLSRRIRRGCRFRAQLRVRNAASQHHDRRPRRYHPPVSRPLEELDQSLPGIEVCQLGVETRL
jgi:hypothetical protein